jgi:hypothetical protein
MDDIRVYSIQTMKNRFCTTIIFQIVAHEICDARPIGLQESSPSSKLLLPCPQSLSFAHTKHNSTTLLFYNLPSQFCCFTCILETSSHHYSRISQLHISQIPPPYYSFTIHCILHFMEGSKFFKEYQNIVTVSPFLYSFT